MFTDEFSAFPVDYPAPLFTLPDLNGRIWSLMALRGKVVVVYFWSAECAWCQRTDPHVMECARKWGDQVVLLPIASVMEEAPEQLRQAARERNLPLVLHDAAQQVARTYRAQTTPHFFVIDAEGILRYQGAFDDTTFRQRTPTRSYVDEAVRALVAGRAPEIKETPPYGCALTLHS
ncbi:MAG: redoxin domain-containing protein [Thermanaerothrix sp.]|nr:redoxin domain-containing protein [Thermanaerothrix sp.]